MKVAFVVVLVALASTGSISTIGQTEGTAKAEMINSFETATNGELRSFLDQYFAVLANRPDSKGMVFTYGPARSVATRNRLIKNRIRVRKFNPTRIEFKSGRNTGKTRTDLWIVPPGTQPGLKREAWIFKDIGRAYKAVVAKAMSDLDKEARKLSGHQSYIINYGTPAQIAQREKWIRNAIPFRRFDASRITLLNGGNDGTVRTVFWLVPPGAENPTP